MAIQGRTPHLYRHDLVALHNRDLTQKLSLNLNKVRPTSLPTFPPPLGPTPLAGPRALGPPQARHHHAPSRDERVGPLPPERGR